MNNFKGEPKLDPDLMICGVRCPKCRAPNVTQVWGHEQGNRENDHLERRCHTCGYKWKVPCADKPPAEGSA